MFKLRKRKKISGSILLEAMIALIILVVIMTASTPPILTAIISKIQSNRIAQAQQLAQLQLENVRALLATGVYTASQLPPTTGSSSRSTLPSTLAPDDISSCSSNPCSLANQAALVNLNGQNYIVQTFRTSGINGATLSASSSSIPIAFKMGVRVYSPSAVCGTISSPSLCGTLSKTNSGVSIGLTSNMSSQISAPLVVSYVDFVSGDLGENTLSTYQTFAGQ